MAVLHKKEEKIQAVLGRLPKKYTHEQFVEMFIKVYSKDWGKIKSAYIKQSQDKEPGTVINMPKPEIYLKQILASYLQNVTVENKVEAEVKGKAEVEGKVEVEVENKAEVEKTKAPAKKKVTEEKEDAPKKAKAASKKKAEITAETPEIKKVKATAKKTAEKK